MEVEGAESTVVMRSRVVAVANIEEALLRTRLILQSPFRLVRVVLMAIPWRPAVPLRSSEATWSLRMAEILDRVLVAGMVELAELEP